MFQTKVVEKIKIHILFSVTFYENRAVYEIMWKNIVERGRPHMAIWRLSIACCIPKATNTQTQVVPYSLLLHCNNVCTNAHQYCIIRTLPVLLERVTFVTVYSISRVLFIRVRVCIRWGGTNICVKFILILFFQGQSSHRTVKVFYFPMTPHVPCGLLGPPSRLWPKCNRRLTLGRPWGAVTLSRWGGWSYMNVKYQEGP
jgi:hypothetical protein